MSTYRFANNANTTLGGAISPVAVSITVASGTGDKFPNPGPGQYFTATVFSSPTGLPNEIVRVTARNGDTMTVERGQEGTTAQSWSVGDTFSNFVTAGFLNQLVDAGSLQRQEGNWAEDQGTANAGSIGLVPAPASLAALYGMPIRVRKQGAWNTGAYTLTVNNLTAPVLIGGAQLQGSELVPSEFFEVVYDGISFDLISNPAVIHGGRLTGQSVDNSKLAPMAGGTIKGNLGPDVTLPYDVPVAALLALLPSITGGVQATGNTNFHIALDVEGIPAPLIIQGGRVNDGNATAIVCMYPVPFTTVAIMGGGTPFTYDNSFSDQDNYVGLSYAPYLDRLVYAVSRHSGDQHVDGCFWWAVGY